MKDASESGFQDTVIQMAHRFGWRAAHFRPARTAKGWRTPVQADGKGWPDLVLVRGEKALFIELKMPGKSLTAEQQQWQADLRKAGLSALIWTPDDWETIEWWLRGAEAS